MNILKKLSAEGKDEQSDISFWIEDFIRNEKLRSITETPSFQRLYDISFLGAIDYSDDVTLCKKGRNRAVHSLYVAGLANYIATIRNYNGELKNNLIAAALVHDIGHIPLSHSAEPYIKTYMGYGHHELGGGIINGRMSKNNELFPILNNSFDIVFINQLLSNKLEIDGGDLFSNQINIDTIDGIIRSLEYKGINNLNRLLIAKSAFFGNEEYTSNFSLLDSFWKAKHMVYYHYINKPVGIIPDILSQVFFQEQNNINEDDLLSGERKWKKKYKTLFDWLKNFKEKKLPECIQDHHVNMIERHYGIMTNELNVQKRYISTKRNRLIKINNLPANSDGIENQLNFDI